MNFKKKRFKNLKIAQLMVDLDEKRKIHEDLLVHKDTLIRYSKLKKDIDENGRTIIVTENSERVFADEFWNDKEDFTIE